MKKYSVIGIVLLILVVFVLVLGFSYAFFTTTVKGKEFVIYTGNLAVDYAKKTDVINIENLYPMTNTEGLTQNSHEFTVTNNGNIDARYQVRLELDTTEKDMIPIEYIKLSYSIDESDYSTPVLLSDLNSSLVFLRNVQLSPTESNTIGIKLWIDINAPNEIQGKVFKTRVVVDSIQDVEDGYVVDTIPIIYLNKDDSGNQDMIINTNSTYTELGVNRVLDDKEVFTKNDVVTTYEYYDGTNTTTVDSVDTSKTGIYYITYSITDSDNNIGKAVRVVAVGDEDTLKIYHDIDSIIASFDSTSLKEVIMCSYIDGNDRLYFDCKIYDTIENALASKTKGVIIMTSDIERDTHITINSDKEIDLELNEKNIVFSNLEYFDIYGNLKINNKTTGSINSNGNVFNNRKNAVLELSNVNVVSTNTDNGSAICTNGKLTVNANTFIEGPYGIGCHNSDTALTIVNGGTVIGNIKSGINLNSGYSGSAIINDGYVEGNVIGLANFSTNNVEINGGNFVSNTNNAIYNGSTGKININQTSSPIYITSLAQTWSGAINNNSSGNINIVANNADACTSNPSDTTSGLCVYAEGDGTTNNTGNTAIVTGSNCTGTININGGTYYGGYVAIINPGYQSGLINVKNAILTSKVYGVITNRTGTTKICNSSISAPNDLVSNNTAIIEYSGDVIFNDGTNTPITLGTGTITQVDACSIVD